MGKRSHLKIVPYKPGEFSLSEVLAKENHSILDSDVDVSAAFSLYFQWPEHRSAVFSQDGVSWEPCELSYDQDEANPTDLHLLEKRGDIILKTDETILIRFEIFRTCYEFQGIVVDPTIKEESIYSTILGFPEHIKVYKHRRVPRIEVHPEFEIQFNAGAETLDLLVTKISIHSLDVKGLHGNQIQGTLLLGGEEYTGELVERGDYSTIILHHESAEDAGRYFDEYRKYVYPLLSPRHEANLDELILQYDAYFKKYIDPNKIDSVKQEVKEVWMGLKDGLHKITADYVAKDDHGNLTGSSSLALAFVDDLREYWAFHQLSSNSTPQLFLQTQSLYLWRIDYLAARPGDLDVVYWYDGNSRWLERVYTKFSMMTDYNNSLFPCVCVSCLPKKLIDADFSIKEDVYERTYAWKSSEQTHAINPHNFNLTNILNHSYKPRESGDGLKNPDDVAGITLDIPRFVTTTSHYKDKGYVLPNVTRSANFAKEALSDFRASVEHAMATSKRKYG